MTGIIGLFDEKNFFSVEMKLLKNTIDPVFNCDTKVFETDFGVLLKAFPKNSHLESSKYYENDSHLCCLNGELIDNQNVPWENIIESIELNRFDRFVSYKSPFVIVVVNKISKYIYIISDRISFQPIYYTVESQNLIFSTALSTFCLFSKYKKFNIEWLYEFLFFNYPIGQTTFLQNIKRMPPATVLQYNLNTKKVILYQYAERFKKTDKLLAGRQGLDRALNVFQERVPKYFGHNIEVACGLSEGLDSRAILSFANQEEINYIKTYTYGTPKCRDIVEAIKISELLKMQHIEIPFDEIFTKELPKLIYETVFLSNGIQSINRSHLTHVYKTLTNHGQRFLAIITGDSGDHLFRDHIHGKGNIPHIIPNDMMLVFGTGKEDVNEGLYRKIINDNKFDDFKEYIHSILKKLRNRHGVFDLPESYLSYLIYEAGPKYLGGDASLANNFSTFRSPYWDSDIIQLAYEIEYGTIGFSEQLSTKDKYKESLLQSFLVHNNVKLSEMSYLGYPIKILSSNNKFLYTIYRLGIKGPKKLISKIYYKPIPPIDDWGNWYHTVLNKEINQLISRDSKICNYVAWDFIKELKEKAGRHRLEKNEIHWLGKIGTAEIVLNLVDNGWKL